MNWALDAWGLFSSGLQRIPFGACKRQDETEWQQPTTAKGIMVPRQTAWMTRKGQLLRAKALGLVTRPACDARVCEAQAVAALIVMEAWRWKAKSILRS